VKFIIKLVIAAVIINACARAGQAAWTYYQLKDVAQQTLIFGATATPTQLHEEILRRAVALEVPLTGENLQVTRNGARTAATASYTQPVELFPNYRYPFKFSFEVDGLAVMTRPEGPAAN
jgi:hypothetical protein